MSQIIAFDFGLARIGVAVGQSITQTASPLNTLKALDGKPDWELVNQLIQQWKPSKVLIGEPFNMDGSDQEITLRARKFANQIHGRFGVQTEMVDERLSSAAAREELFEFGGYKKLKKSQIDSVAAALILESWFMHNPA
ncbi:Holliday junction resolvase RuvX [Aliikangiella sp. IMCC44359]|uniref:Holliday junction resolvase RuvX n=1 Tax=Aliikangiella sp. IMCC44359 TaxID=3459125 RepID=UPI00403AEEEF